MSDNELRYLKDAAKRIRISTLESIVSIGMGHVGGCFSIADLLAVLYFKHMNIDPKNPRMAGRDRLIMSKGHAGTVLYAALAEKGYFDRDVLKTLNKLGTTIPSHCNMNLTPGVDMTTGSLGLGLSCAVGAALGSRIAKDNATIYCIIGDGESQEGQIWEALMSAAHYKLDNLIVFFDNNGYQIDGAVNDIMSLEPIQEKFTAFGFHTLQIDGHNLEAIDNAILDAKCNTGSPTMIILNTVKGKGLSIAEKLGVNSHSMPVSYDDLELAKTEIL